jgi:isoquinoline 1-oxidoreductase beta subunit
MRQTRDLDICPEPERYELDEASRYRFDLSRRSFLGVTGAGLLIVASHEATQAQTRSQRDTIGARLHIGKDGKITLMTSKVEVGQGSRTQLAQAAAEELRVNVEQIDLVMADTAQVPDDGGTAGSRTTPSTVPAVRKGAATAREVLIKLAREQWSVEGLLKVEGGKVTDPASGRTLSYADLAALVDLPKSFDQAIPADVKLYPVDQWTVLGTSPQKANARNIVTGSHRYPSDVVF